MVSHQCVMRTNWYPVQHFRQYLRHFWYWYWNNSSLWCFLECPHLIFLLLSLFPSVFFIPLRNQAMRKKLILYFKRRNHARKQWVSRERNILDSLLGPSLWWMTSVKLGQLLLEVSGHFRQTKKEQNMICCQYCALGKKKKILSHCHLKEKLIFFYAFVCQRLSVTKPKNMTKINWESLGCTLDVDIIKSTVLEESHVWKSGPRFYFYRNLHLSSSKK